ncbi:MAG: histidine--tRNA ligase [Spirochaetales bacterium]|nr:histidine--tRNA ligase [Spirochaetales bacterium]
MIDYKVGEDMIDPIVLKGFRDSLPNEEIPKRRIMRTLEDQFQNYGFVPIDTPALEYTQVLLGKGGGETDKQIFHFQDNGGREVAMRFDLTVPFARFLALHLAELPLPFKRYHMDKVWRGEKPQKGRFREFIQCDFDIVGVDNAQADFEILSLMDASFKKLGIEKYTFLVAHRGLFNFYLEKLGVKEESVEILRTVDKIKKIGEEEVLKLLTEITHSEEKAQSIIAYITPEEKDSFLTRLDKLVALCGAECESSLRLRKIYALLEATGIAKHFTLDPSITRGLDYYTGIVYETILDELPQIGSVCSGGRYNNLASLYTKELLPGVGSSIGLDRLLAALTELNSPILANSSSVDFIIYYKEEETAKAMQYAKRMREANINTIVYLDPNKKMKAQYEYATKNNIKFALTFNDTCLSVKNLETRETVEYSSIEEVITQCNK